MAVSPLQYKQSKNHCQALNSHNPKSKLKVIQMERDTNGIQTLKKPHGIVTKVPIQSGNVSNHETIEALTKSARTGNHASSVRTIPITYVWSYKKVRIKMNILKLI